MSEVKELEERLRKITYNFKSNYSRIFHIVKLPGGGIDVCESCDDYFTISLTKEEAIKEFEKCIAFIKGEINE